MALGILLVTISILSASCGGSSAGTPSTVVQQVHDYNHPTDITAAPDGSRLYIANNVRNTVSVVDPSTMVQLADIRVSCAPRNLVVNATNSKLYVSHDNTTGCRLSPLTQLDTDSSTGYAGTKLSLIDLTTNSLVKEIRLNGMEFEGRTRSVDTGRGMAWDTTSGVLFVAGLNSSSITMIDTVLVDTLTTPQVTFTADTNGEVLGFVRDVANPVDVALTTDGATLIAPQTSGGNLSLIDTSTNKEYTGSPWTLSGCSSPTNPLIYKASGDSNSNKYAFVSCYGSDSVKIYDISDPSSGSATLLGTISLGIQGANNVSDKPTVLALSSDGSTLLVLNTATGYVQTIPWSLLKQGSGEVYGRLFPVRTIEKNVNTLVSDMALIGTTVYVTDMLANRIYKFSYTDSSLATATITYNSSAFASFPY